jgi:hypothetical protein
MQKAACGRDPQAAFLCKKKAQKKLMPLTASALSHTSFCMIPHHEIQVYTFFVIFAMI